MERYKPQIGIAAGSLMIKWNTLTDHINMSGLKFIESDRINVFINCESILANIIKFKNLNSLVNFHKREVTLELESSILNLVANYKMYFKKYSKDIHVYLYMTSLSDNKQLMNIYNPNYRSYYKNQYTRNPNNKQMGSLLTDIILEELKLIMTYIPDVHFIESSNFDSIIIPKIISDGSNCKNVIITTDVYDSLYMFDPNFSVVYIKRNYSDMKIHMDIDSTVRTILSTEQTTDTFIFKSEFYFKLLLAIKGSRIRNIKSVKGFGYNRFIRIIKSAIDKGIILSEYESIQSVIHIFPEKFQDDIKNAFRCVNMDMQYDLLSEADILSIKNQIVNKIDIESLNILNNKRFLEFPINLQGLI